MAKKKKRKIDPAAESFHTALSLLDDIPILGPLYSQAVVLRHGGYKCPSKGCAVVTSNGEIHVHPARRSEPEEWVYIAAHCLLHLGFGHFREQDDFYIWNLACDFVINGWLLEMEAGKMPGIGILHDRDFRGMSAESVYDRIMTDLRRYRKIAALRGTGLGDILYWNKPDWWKTGGGEWIGMSFTGDVLCRGWNIT